MRDRDLGALEEKVARLWPHLDERARRLFAASEARELGRGGVSAVSRVCGLSRPTINKGMRELNEPPLPPGRVRRPGGGRPRIEESDPDLLEALDALVEPLSRGDPESPLRWTSKGTRVLAGELTAGGHPVSHETVAQLLKAMEYSLPGTRKTEEGKQHPDRDAQFRFINEEVRKALAAKRPVISVDTKKKELVGNFENKGRKWRRAKDPERVGVHDFPTPEVPRAYPCYFLTLPNLTNENYWWTPSAAAKQLRPAGHAVFHRKRRFQGGKFPSREIESRQIFASGRRRTVLRWQSAAASILLNRPTQSPIPVRLPHRGNQTPPYGPDH